MSKLSINGKEYVYHESEIIAFTEGLIGLPQMRRAALIPLSEFSPFCWLASVDDEKCRFIVVNPQEIYKDYATGEPTAMGLAESAKQKSLKPLAIVKISTDWRKTTVNLRAPIYIDTEKKRGAQLILNDSRYKLAESLPNN
jgi:flagellar assembly factor FliW